jgi:hypothetical protein
MKQSGNQDYEPATLKRGYPAPGSMEAWFNEEAKVVGMTIELRDKGYYDTCCHPLI